MPGRKSSAPVRRRALREEEEESTPRRGRASRKESSTKTSTGSGWGAVVKRKEEADRKREAAEERKNKIWDFYLRDGETAVIQFLDDAPYCYDGHNLKDSYGNFVFVPCQLSEQKHCLACRESSNISWKAAFKVLDYRTKNKAGDMVYTEEPTEKLWKVGQQLAQQIKAFIDKKGKDLTEVCLEVTRSGKGAKDTSYNIGLAYDEDDEKIEPIEWKHKFGPTSELCAPPDDDEYIDNGYYVPEEKSSK